MICEKCSQPFETPPKANHVKYCPACRQKMNTQWACASRSRRQKKQRSWIGSQLREADREYADYCDNNQLDRTHIMWDFVPSHTINGKITPCFNRIGTVQDYRLKTQTAAGEWCRPSEALWLERQKQKYRRKRTNVN